MCVFQGKEEGAGEVKHDIQRWWGVRTLYGEAPKDGTERKEAAVTKMPVSDLKVMKGLGDGNVARDVHWCLLIQFYRDKTEMNCEILLTIVPPSKALFTPNYYSPQNSETPGIQDPPPSGFRFHDLHRCPTSPLRK